MSYPPLRHYLTRQLSSPSPPRSSNRTVSLSTHKNAPLYSGLHDNDNHLSSIPNTRTQDENMYYSTDKSSDEYGISKDTPIMLYENNDNDRSTIKTEPMEIRVRCIFSRVGEIDTLNERYTAEIFFEATWFDQDHRIGSKYDPQAGHFNPQLVVLNHIGDSLRHDVKKNILLKKSYFCFFIPRNGIQLIK